MRCMELAMEILVVVAIFAVIAITTRAFGDSGNGRLGNPSREGTPAEPHRSHWFHGRAH
jgi:hypothetical protein